MWPADWSRVKAPASLAHVTGIVTNAGASFQCGVNKSPYSSASHNFHGFHENRFECTYG